MKFGVTILLSLIVPAFLPMSGKRRSADRVLSVKCGAVESVRNTVEGPVWKFKSVERENITPMYMVYGDTLTAEIYNGTRQWYRHIGDSTYYIGEESRYHKVTTEFPLLTTSFGNRIHGNVAYDFSSGDLFLTYALEHCGTYDACLPQIGTIITPMGTSVRSEAISEIRRFKESVCHDSIENTENIIKEVKKTRWFVKGDHLPVALQIEENYYNEDSRILSNVHTFIVDQDDLKIERSLQYDVQVLLDEAAISVKGGRLKIEGKFPAQTEIMLYISTLAGFHMFQNAVITGDPESPVEVALSDLPVGEYMLSLSVEQKYTRKVLIRVC